MPYPTSPTSTSTISRSWSLPNSGQLFRSTRPPHASTPYYYIAITPPDLAITIYFCSRGLAMTESLVYITIVLVSITCLCSPLRGQNGRAIDSIDVSVHAEVADQRPPQESQTSSIVKSPTTFTSWLPAREKQLSTRPVVQPARETSAAQVVSADAPVKANDGKSGVAGGAPSTPPNSAYRNSTRAFTLNSPILTGASQPETQKLFIRSYQRSLALAKTHPFSTQDFLEHVSTTAKPEWAVTPAPPTARRPDWLLLQPQSISTPSPHSHDGQQ